MSKSFIGLLSDYVEFSNEDYQQAMKWERSLQGDARTISHLASGHGGGMGSLPIQVGNVEISQPTGVQLKNPSTGKRTVWADPIGDFYVGSNIDLPSQTSMLVLSNEQKYNGETLGAGDMLLGDNSASKANLLWDASAGQLQLRSGSNSGIILDTNGTLRSGNYSSGASGWVINPNGDAEFNNITARGTIRTSVFQKDNVIATGGDILVSKNAGEVYEDVTTPATLISFTLKIKDDDGDTSIAAVNDVLRIKGFNGSALIDVWATVTAVSDQTGYTSYTCDLESGTSKTVESGMAVVNYGPSGAGLIHLEAGATTTRMRIATHAGAPWTTETNQVVLGNLRGVYGAGANDYYGIGLGDYSGGNYLSYNADGSGTFVVKGGDGGITYDDTGLSIVANTSDAWTTKHGIAWLDGAGGSALARVWTWISSNSPVMKMEAVNKGSGGSGGTDTSIDIFSDAGYLKTGNITLRASSDNLDNSSSLTLENDDAGDDFAQLSTNGWVELIGSLGTYVGTGGLYVGSSQPTSMPVDQIQVDGAILSTGGTIRTEGTSDPTNWGDGGVEVSWETTKGRVLAYGRGPTTNADQPLELRGSKITLNESGSTYLTLDGGDIYTQPFADYSASSTVVGWSSFTNKKIYYKTVGDLVYVWFYLRGTSNSTSVSFTVPYAAKNISDHYCQNMIRGADNGGTTAVGFMTLGGSSSTVTCYRTPHSTPAWTASGTKFVLGQFHYQRD